MLTINELKEQINNRDVYIWGTRIAGLSALKIMIANGVDVKAFIDSTPCAEKKTRLDVILPDNFFCKDQDKVFVIICTRGHSPHIAKICQEHGVRYIEWEKLQRFDYYIEVTNRCNLNCLTCSSREYYNEPVREMTLPEFAAVIGRIRENDPLASWINLFGHNEAFLNNSLPEMISAAKAMNFSVGLSTNLAFTKDFKAVIQAGPAWVRVSMSGCGDNYEIIHRGAKWHVLYRNLISLSTYRESFSPDTIVEIFFHEYTHNKGDIEKVKNMCRAFGFEFRCIYASVIGFETVSNILDGRPVSRKISGALKYLCHSVEETAEQAFGQKDVPCPNDHMVRIHSDLTVAECMAWMGSVIPGKTFLEIPYNDLEQALTHTKYCPICKPRGLHQFCEIVFGEGKHDT
jgi:molybdenum cofactor biosynthesis enzyme MoaA